MAVTTNWTTGNLSDLCVLQRGFDLPKSKRTPGPYPLIASNGPIDTHNEYRVTAPGVVTGRSGSIGNVVYVANDFWPLNTTLYVKDFKKNNPRFVYYFLQHFKLGSYASGTGVPTLNRNDVHSVSIKYPSTTAQQERIVAVLDLAESQISSTEKEISVLRVLKKSLMKSLLTNGIGHQTFVETEIGKMPSTWRSVTLGECCNITKLAGYEYSKHFNGYKDGGEITVIRGKNIKDGRLDLTDIKMIPKVTSDYLIRSKLNQGDLVFSYVGTIGPVALIDKNDTYHLGPNVAKISPKKTDISSNYLYQYFCGPPIINEIRHLTSVTAQPSLSMEKIRRFRVMLPPLHEQIVISEILEAIDKKIRINIELNNQQKRLRLGLMHDLLSGKTLI